MTIKIRKYSHAAISREMEEVKHQRSQRFQLHERNTIGKFIDKRVDGRQGPAVEVGHKRSCWEDENVIKLTYGVDSVTL